MRFSLFVALLLAGLSSAQTVQNVDPHVRVVVVDGGLAFSVNPLANSSAIDVTRYVVGSTQVLGTARLDAGTTQWVEPFVSGTRGLFRVQRTQASSVAGQSVLLVGNEAPFRDDQGVAVVVVDTVNAARLRPQLDQFESDLRDDGFTVIEETVARGESPPSIKARLVNAAGAASGRRVHVVLLGAVTRAFSGIQAPDGHGDHSGAWPADPYYADLTGLTWTDTRVGGVGAHVNNAGDGRFDQTNTSAVEVLVGRVDFEGMPVFGADAGTVQLGVYLEKTHRFRSGDAPLPKRALVWPTFGYFGGEAFGRVGYRDGTAITGSSPETSEFFPRLTEDGGVLMAWGDGSGGPTSAGGVTTSTQLAASFPLTRFMGLFGSYFGDWNYTNNLMRAALGSGETVASLWYARPATSIYGLGALETFGESFSRDDLFRLRAMPVYQALLGDPTLRLFYPRRLSSLAAVPLTRSVELSWSAFTGPEPLIGYHVYRSIAGARPERLTLVPTSMLRFEDTTVPPSVTAEWRVVAVVREVTGSGTFWNHSLGARTTATSPVFDAGVVFDAGSPVDAGVDAGMAVDAGSESDGGLGPRDAGMTRDAGVVVDAGVVDAGVAVDAGVELDAGVEVDAGVAVDAGVEVDAGLELDAGLEVDAGVFVDAGTAIDAGSEVDAGTTTDAGYQPLPLPEPEPEPTPGGCQCQSADAAMWLLGLAFLVLRRRQ